jgi:hypothetical protein
MMKKHESVAKREMRMMGAMRSSIWRRAVAKQMNHTT